MAVMMFREFYTTVVPNEISSTRPSLTDINAEVINKRNHGARVDGP